MVSNVRLSCGFEGGNTLMDSKQGETDGFESTKTSSIRSRSRELDALDTKAMKLKAKAFLMDSKPSGELCWSRV